MSRTSWGRPVRTKVGQNMLPSPPLRQTERPALCMFTMEDAISILGASCLSNSSPDTVSLFAIIRNTVSTPGNIATCASVGSEKCTLTETREELGFLPRRKKETPVGIGTRDPPNPTQEHPSRVGHDPNHALGPRAVEHQGPRETRAPNHHRLAPAQFNRLPPLPSDPLFPISNHDRFIITTIGLCINTYLIITKSDIVDMNQALEGKQTRKDVVGVAAVIDLVMQISISPVVKLLRRISTQNTIQEKAWERGEGQ